MSMYLKRFTAIHANELFLTYQLLHACTNILLSYSGIHMDCVFNTLVLKWLADSYFTTTRTSRNIKNQKGTKGDELPSVGGGERKEKEKSTEKKQGGTRDHPETTCSLTVDTSDDEVKKWDMPPSLEGAKEQMAIQGEYISFTITQFHLFIIFTAPFHHLIISPCEPGCIICTISPH